MLKVTFALILLTITISNSAFACGDNREDFKKYVASADYIVLAGVVAMEQLAYRDFILKSANTFTVEQGLPIDISRYRTEFSTEVLHVFKGRENTPREYYQMPCRGKLELGTLYVIFSNETADGYDATIYDAYKFPEIIEHLEKR